MGVPRTGRRSPGAWLHNFVPTPQCDAARPPVPPAGPVEQGAVTAIIDSTTAFAKALKDLEFGGRLMTVGVLLIAISALAAGLDEVAQAVTDVADAVKTG